MDKKFAGLQGHWFTVDGQTCIVSHLEKSGRDCLVHSTSISDAGVVEKKTLPIQEVLDLMEFEEVDMSPPGKIWQK